MKVLYVSHDTVLNGAPKSLLEYVSVIKQKGVTPIVLIPNTGKLKEELDKIGVKNIIIPYKQCVYTNKLNRINYLKYIQLNVRAIYKITKYIRKEKIDIVHSNSFAVDVGAMAAYFADVPHIWHLREYLKEDFDYKLIMPRLAKQLIRKSRCCIAISKGIQRKYKEKYNIKPVLLYNGINNKLYFQPIIFKKENKIDTKNLLIAGFICEGKGQWDAIRAVEILVNKNVDIRLNIVGSGRVDYINKLKKYVREHNIKKYITFIKYTSNLMELRNLSDAILVCSRMEAFGRVTAEAMMSGKIVIGAKSGGTLDLIGKNEERGYLYQYNNPEELADKIEYVFEHKVEVDKKVLGAQKYILKLTDISKYTDKLLKIYKNTKK